MKADTFNTLRALFVEYDKADMKAKRAADSEGKASDDISCLIGTTLTHDTVRLYNNAMARVTNAQRRWRNAEGARNAAFVAINKVL